jgi:hypothetical protein
LSVALSWDLFVVGKDGSGAADAGRRRVFATYGVDDSTTGPVGLLLRSMYRTDGVPGFAVTILQNWPGGTSTNIADYNSFVQTQASGATYAGATVNWKAVGSTATVDARDNVGGRLALSSSSLSLLSSK